MATSGTGASFGLDAASFAVAAGTLVGLHWRQKPGSTGKSLLAEAAEGIRYILSRRWLSLRLGGAAVANLVGAGPYVVLLPVLVRQVLHARPLTLGLVYASGRRRRCRGVPGGGQAGLAQAPSGGDVGRLQPRLGWGWRQWHSLRTLGLRPSSAPFRQR